MRIFVQIATEITIFLIVPVLSKERMKEFFHFREEGVKVGAVDGSREPFGLAKRRVGGLSVRRKRPLGLFESSEIPFCSIECLCV